MSNAAPKQLQGRSADGGLGGGDGLAGGVDVQLGNGTYQGTGTVGFGAGAYGKAAAPTDGSVDPICGSY